MTIGFKRAGTSFGILAIVTALTGCIENGTSSEGGTPVMVTRQVELNGSLDEVSWDPRNKTEATLTYATPLVIGGPLDREGAISEATGCEASGTVQEPRPAPPGMTAVRMTIRC